MTGIIEQIAADVAFIRQAISQAGAGQQQQLAPLQQQPLQQQPLQQQPLQQQPLGGAVQYPAATAEMITALITPWTGDVNMMNNLRAQMHQMSISALPEAQPHQYGELYYRFQQTIGAVQQQQQAQPQPAAAPASII